MPDQVQKKQTKHVDSKKKKKKQRLKPQTLQRYKKGGRSVQRGR